MPLTIKPKSKLRGLGVQPQGVAALATQRERLKQQTRKWREKHAAIFEHMEGLEEEITNVENRIKDQLRGKYSAGSPRGNHMVYESKDLYVKVTVKYGKPEAEHFKKVDWYDRVPGLVKTVEVVDMDAIQDAVEEGLISEDERNNMPCGEFMTPSITIKDKLPMVVKETEGE